MALARSTHSKAAFACFSKTLKTQYASPAFQTLQTRNVSYYSSSKPTAKSAFNPRQQQQTNFINKREFHASNVTRSDDFYDRLGVSKDATSSEIKKKYYQLAKKFHPDVNKEAGAKEKFFKIQEAYDTLSDDQKRASYDQFGTADPSGGYPGGSGGFSGFYGAGGSAPSMDDIFSQIFGSGFGGAGGPRGAGGPGGGPTNRGSFRSTGEDITSTVNITFEEAVSGVQKKVRSNPVLECKTCDGNGVKKGAKASKCSTCNGTGRQTFSMGGFHVQQSCSSCGGSGSAISKKDICGSCNGRGVVQGSETVNVDIPAGCDSGMVVDMAGFGDAPMDGKGPRGSLYVKVRVAESKLFTRKGSDVFYTTTISLSQALLGSEITIPTVQGNVDVVIKPGTQPGDELRLRGKGMKKVRGFGHGDFYLTIKVEIPKNLTKSQKELAQQFSDDLEGKPKNQNTNNNSSDNIGASTNDQDNSKSEEKPQDESDKNKKNKGLFGKLKDELSNLHKKKSE